MEKLTDILIGVLIIAVVTLILYMRFVGDELHKISAYSSHVSCDELPYGIQDKIEGMYNNLDTERVNREIEVKCQ